MPREIKSVPTNLHHSPHLLDTRRNNACEQPLLLPSNIINLPSYIVPVLCDNQCNQCTSSFFLRQDRPYDVLEDEVHYINELLVDDSEYDQYDHSRSVYLDQYPPSILDTSQTDMRASSSVKSLYRAHGLNSTGTEFSFEPTGTETSSEFDTAIMSLDPSACFSLYQESLLLRNDTPRHSDKVIIDDQLTHDIYHKLNVNEQAHISSEELKLPVSLGLDEEKIIQVEQSSSKEDAPKKSSGYVHGRLIKIFYEYFISGLATLNAYFYQYFLQYLLFI